jgi:outer membrane protein OmpA-like peptidoglycan-associated protein
MYSSDPRKSARARGPGRAVRHLAASACLAAAAILAACQSAPPVADAPPRTPVARATQIETVRALGFSETADGGWLINLSEAILFGVDRDRLTPETEARIAKMAQDLQRAGVHRLRIEGHTDNYGARAYNVELSLRRAETVAQAFVANGFPSDAIERRGHAFDFPVAPNATGDGRARNRRVTVMVAADELATK